jgi:dihydrofolate reductase
MTVASFIAAQRAGHKVPHAVSCRALEMPASTFYKWWPKYVASRTLAEPLEWQGSAIVGESLAEDVTALKGRHDELHVIGSLDLMQSLLRFGLVDRLNLWLYPVLLGTGKQVFADGTVPTALRLIESVTYPSGTLQLTYDLAGTPTYGTIGS